MMMEGALAIQEGMNPNLIREKLELLRRAEDSRERERGSSGGSADDDALKQGTVLS